VQPVELFPEATSSSHAGSLVPEGIFLSAQKRIQKMENRTSAAKAGYGSVIYGTAEPVPFQGDPSSHADSLAPTSAFHPRSWIFRQPVSLFARCTIPFREPRITWH
jgi:hypothetical protein